LLPSPLQASIGESTSAACRADFGDARCQASLATWRDTYTLASVTDARTLVLTGPAQITAPATYANGLLEVMDGPAAGLQMEVRSWTSGTLTLGLYLPLPVAPEAGDTVRVTTGCDKSLATCRDTFANKSASRKNQRHTKTSTSRTWPVRCLTVLHGDCQSSRGRLREGSNRREIGATLRIS
jgi:uncharacterized phage protein (TIGR02218 family)